MAASCDPTKRTAPCNEISEHDIPYVGVHWERPDSRGYDITYIPADAYQIEYYRVEAATDSSFTCVLASVTCKSGDANEYCNFNEYVARLDLSETGTYSMRVVAGTII